jgi:membrane protein DedA with SNARE-associated domain
MEAYFAAHLGEWVQYAAVWGYIVIVLLMAIESSFIPFPSEVVMIPAGFLAARGELTCGIPWLDCLLAIVIGLAGSMGGAYFNYYLAQWLGEPFLRKYGKYFFISPATLDRAEEIFRKYGDVATFVCRLLPAIRQLISLPAGLAKMDIRRFSFFTALGAGLWTAVLTGIGYYLGMRTREADYPALVAQGKEMIQNNYGWILLGLAIFCIVYFTVQHFVMKSTPEKK